MAFKNPSSMAFSGLFWPFRRRLVKQTDAVLKHALSSHTKTVQGIFDDVLLFFSYTFTYLHSL